MSDSAARYGVVHVDLAAPLCVVSSPRDIAGLQLVFWFDGLPLGRCEVTPDALPLSIAALAALASQAVAPAVGARLFAQGFAAPLRALHPEAESVGDVAALLACERPLDELRTRLMRRGGGTEVAERADACTAPHTTPARADGAPAAADVSVVVCTRDRPEALARCLASLRRARVRPREIVVVDNAPSTDGTRRVVSALPEVRYVHEPRPGLAIARNTGVRATTGHIVAFTDDDVMVDAEWISRLLPPFAQERVMAVTGIVLPGELESTAQRMAEERLWSFNREFRPRTFDAQYFARMRARGVPVWHVGAGANMAVRRDAFARVGPFDERLGAGAAGCSEDSEFWYRLLAEGWSCVYEPAAVVFHFHRADLDGLRRQWHAYMRGHVAALLVQFARYRHWGNLRRIALQLPIFYALWLRDLLRRRRRDEAALWWAAVSGAIAGIGFYVRHRQTAACTSPTRDAVAGRGVRAARRAFLRANPFPHPRTAGFFYREKMRAIHRVAPERAFHTVLEIGGGQSGLTALLYPHARVVNVERAREFARTAPTPLTFVCGDATRLPFASASVDAVTIFDVLEHIADDAAALREALRVLRPGGALLISAPNERWRFPYYRFMRGLCPSDAAIMTEWGHVRRGYAVSQLDGMLALPHVAATSFISPWTALSHDLAFSRLPAPLRHIACATIAPVVWGASLLDDGRRGTETVALWIKPAG